MPTASKLPQQKVRRHRKRQREMELRPLQIWVPDTRSRRFAERIKRQCIALQSDRTEVETATFSEIAASLIKGWE